MPAAVAASEVNIELGTPAQRIHWLANIWIAADNTTMTNDTTIIYHVLKRPPTSVEIAISFPQLGKKITNIIIIDNTTMTMDAWTQLLFIPHCFSMCWAGALRSQWISVAGKKYRNFSARQISILLGKYISQQTWIATDYMTTTKDAWRNQYLPHSDRTLVHHKELVQICYCRFWYQEPTHQYIMSFQSIGIITSFVL